MASQPGIRLVRGRGGPNGLCIVGCPTEFLIVAPNCCLGPAKRLSQTQQYPPKDRFHTLRLRRRSKPQAVPCLQGAANAARLTMAKGCPTNAVATQNSGQKRTLCLASTMAESCRPNRNDLFIVCILVGAFSCYVVLIRGHVICRLVSRETLSARRTSPWLTLWDEEAPLGRLRIEPRR